MQKNRKQIKTRGRVLTVSNGWRLYFVKCCLYPRPYFLAVVLKTPSSLHVQNWTLRGCTHRTGNGFLQNPTEGVGSVSRLPQGLITVPVSRNPIHAFCHCPTCSRNLTWNSKLRWCWSQGIPLGPALNSHKCWLMFTSVRYISCRNLQRLSGTQPHMGKRPLGHPSPLRLCFIDGAVQIRFFNCVSPQPEFWPLTEHPVYSRGV